MSALCAAVGFSAAAALDATDFTFDQSESVRRWDLSSTNYDSGNGRKFEKDSEAIVSPLYPGAVVEIGVRAKMYGQDIAAYGSTLGIEGRAAESSPWREVFSLAFQNQSLTNVTVSLARSENYRQFRLIFHRRNGTMRVGAFSAEWLAADEVRAPRDLAAADVASDSFRASWTSDDPADEFLFDCWSVSMRPWSGEALWQELFSSTANVGGNPKPLNELSTDVAGWSGERVFVPARSSGAVQIGSTEGGGWALSPQLSAIEDVTLIVRARAHTYQRDREMAVLKVGATATNTLASFTLDIGYSDYAVGIPSVAEGERLLFRSFASGSERRVLLDAVYLVRDFVPSVPVTNYVCESVILPASACAGHVVDGLSAETDYAFSVRAVSGGVESPVSETYQVRTLGSAVPAAMIAISSLPRSRSRRVWTEDFSAAADIFPSSDNDAAWVDFLTLPPWQLLRGEAAPAKVTRNNGAGTASGFYFYWATNKTVESYALGTLTGGSVEPMTYGLSFCNDTATAVRSVSISYDGMQFGFKNSVPQDLICEYRISSGYEGLSAQEGWTSCDELLFRTSADSTSGLLGGKDLPVADGISAEDIQVEIPPGAYFTLRWRRMPAVNAAAMAIDNVCVSFTSGQRALAIVVR